LVNVLLKNEDSINILKQLSLKDFSMQEIVNVRNYLFQNRNKISSNTDLLYFWGKIEKSLKVMNVAFECFQNALKIDKNHIESLRELGFLMAESGRHLEAIEYFKTITQLNPSDWEAWNDGGCIFRANGSNEQATLWMEEASKSNESNAVLFANLALLEYEANNYTKTQEYLDKAFEIDPKNPEALHTQAMLLSSIGQHEESYQYDVQALSVKPNYPQARLGLALSALTLGNLEEGFAGYEHRWAGSDKSETNILPTIKRSQWLGQTVYPSSTLTVLPEQGFGDMIQFARFIPLLKKKFHTINWMMPIELERLIAHSFSDDNVKVSSNMDSLDIRTIDYEIPLMSLGLALKVNLENLVSSDKYLQVPKEGIEYFSNKLKNIQGLKVGIAYGGKPTLSKDELRSIKPSLLSVLNISNVTFVNLQKFENKKAVLPPLDNFVDLIDECMDFMDTAALIENLDLVISVDTSIVHLAGALGKPTWLLNRYGSEWRWMDKKETTPWYPTMKIYNQTQLKDWESVLEKVMKDLKKFTTLNKKLKNSQKEIL